MGVASGVGDAVQLILKKWGDDIAGASSDLVRKMDIPEEVATRIAKGDLPMDDASRAARAAEQGYGDVLYRGHNSKKNPISGSDDIWMTDSPASAQTYADAVNEGYAPEAPDFEGWYSYYKEGDISDVSGDADLKALKKEYDGFLKNWNDTQPPPPGVVTPLRHNATEMAPVRADGKHFESVQTNSNKLKGLQANPETKGIHRGTDAIAEAVKDSGSYQGTLFKGVKDDFEVGKGTQRSNVHNVLGSRPDVNIRHANAAFDPMYKGDNIMGNATVPVLGGTAAITAGALAAPALMKDGVFQHTASDKPIVERKEPVRNQSSLLESVTDFGDEVFKSVRHAAGPLAEVLMPYEGVNNYLKTVNDYDKQPTWRDRLGLLDL